MAIYTDIAREAKALDPDIEGVKEHHKEYDGIGITRIDICTETAARRLGKAMGRYVSIDYEGGEDAGSMPYTALVQAIESELMPFISAADKEKPVLIAGLGNRSVTPDALGPMTAERILVTRHIKKYLPEAFTEPVISTTVTSPGVLGSTGMETSELIGALVKTLEPGLVIAIDSLAARDAERLGASVQISDAGIEPGAGVGNLRTGINEHTLGVPVIAVGVPLVVYASTIVCGVLSSMAKKSGEAGGEEALFRLADEVMKGRPASMIVTPKDVDRLVRDASAVLAEGINRALFGKSYPELVKLLS